MNEVLNYSLLEWVFLFVILVISIGVFGYIIREIVLLLNYKGEEFEGSGLENNGEQCP